MRYHVVLWQVPDPLTTTEIPIIDEEFDSEREADEALLAWVLDWHEALLAWVPDWHETTGDDDDTA